MNLYLVRHGRTTHNEAGQSAPVTSPLNELGIKQAISVGDRLKKTPFDKIFVSDAKRAVDTASHIAKHHMGTEVVETVLLREHKKPTEMEGLEYESEKVQKIYGEIEKNMERRDWHFSDEENYYDFRQRLLEFLDVAAAEKGENVLAVTHSLVIRLLACLVIFERNLSATDFQRARWNLKVINTGVSVITYRDRGWELLTFNDMAHLAQ